MKRTAGKQSATRRLPAGVQLVELTAETFTDPKKLAELTAILEADLQKKAKRWAQLEKKDPNYFRKPRGIMRELLGGSGKPPRH